MSQDPLFQPTVRAPAAAARPWRLQPLGYVAFLGGVTAVTVLSLMNAARLGVPAASRWAIGLLGAAGLAASITTVALVHTDSGRGLHLLVRLIAVGVFLGQAALQKRYDRGFHMRGGDYAGLLLPGAIAVIACGLPEAVVLAVVALAVRL